MKLLLCLLLGHQASKHFIDGTPGGYTITDAEGRERITLRFCMRCHTVFWDSGGVTMSKEASDA